MSLGGFRPESDRTLQMNQRGSKVSLLAEDESQQTVRLRMSLIKTKRFGELLLGSVKIASRSRFLAAFVQIVRGAWRNCARPACRRALLF